MHESRKMQDLLESVKKVMRGEELTEARMNVTKAIKWKPVVVRTNATRPVNVKVTKVEFEADYDRLDGSYDLYLKAYFDPSTWNVRKMGLIYTDKDFEANFRKALEAQGYPVGRPSNVSYSEEGMQGRNHVHFDIYDKGNDRGIEKQWLEMMGVPMSEEKKQDIKEAPGGYDQAQFRAIQEATRRIVDELKSDGLLPEIFDLARMRMKSSSSTPMIEYAHGSGSRGVTFVWEGVGPMNFHSFVGTSKVRSWQNFVGEDPREVLQDFLDKYPYKK